MSCEKYLNFIDDLVEGELDEQSVRRVNSHIFACPKCAAHYQFLKQEKEIYAHYLFDVEPSTDLWAKFQTKMENRTSNTPFASRIFAVVANFKANTIGFLRFYPALAGAVLLIFLGIGFSLMKFIPNEKDAEIGSAAGTELRAVQMENTTSGEISENAELNFSAKTVFAANAKNKARNAFSKRKTAIAANVKNAAVKVVRTKNNAAFKTENGNLAAGFQLSEEEKMQIRQAKALETETARQIEKIELLLRSFRNARQLKDGETFDVAYEKEQARKLLEKNVQLRRNAENFGTLYAQELLGRAEPLLLDIANLENNPAPEKVSDIKARVRNQNIIASLQIY